MLKDVFPEDEYEKVKAKEDADRKMLAIEYVIVILGIAILFCMVAMAAYIPMATWTKVCLLTLGFISVMVCITLALLIEQKAGYYECSKCNYRYVPTFAQIFFGINIGRLRYLKCPECKKRSWNRKVISKD